MLNIQETINANVSENTQSVVQNVALFGAGVAVGVALDRAFCWARGKYAAYKIGKAEVQAEVKAEAKPEVKPEAQPEVKTEAQSEAQAEAKPEAQAEAQSEAQPEVKTEAKAEDNK